jgi:hypothetical protein
LSGSSKNLSPEQRVLRAKLAGTTRWGQVPPGDRPTETLPARSKFLDRFAAYPDPESAKKAYFAGLAFRSSKARGRRKADVSNLRAAAAESNHKSAATGSPALAAMAEGVYDSPTAG